MQYVDCYHWATYMLAATSAAGICDLLWTWFGGRRGDERLGWKVQDKIDPDKIGHVAGHVHARGNGSTFSRVPISPDLDSIKSIR